MRRGRSNKSLRAAGISAGTADKLAGARAGKDGRPRGWGKSERICDTRLPSGTSRSALMPRLDVASANGTITLHPSSQDELRMPLQSRRAPAQGRAGERCRELARHLTCGEILWCGGRIPSEQADEARIYESPDFQRRVARSRRVRVWRLTRGQVEASCRERAKSRARKEMAGGAVAC
jgi:hypothetical protein